MPPQQPQPYYQPPQPPVQTGPGAGPDGQQHDPYGFILNPQQPQKQRGPLKGGKKPLVLLLSAAAVGLVLLLVIISLFSGGNKATQPYITMAQEQREIARVAQLQYPALTDQATKNFAISSQLTMTADNATLLKYLSNKGMKIPEKQLGLGLDSTTDTQLTTAMSTSSLDTTLDKILREELTTYKGSVQKAYSATGNSQSRTLLKQLYNNADLLLAQSQQQ